MAVKDLTPEALRRLMQEQHERSYVLVDVRQPGEYEQAHIPGARLLPLPEFFQSMENLSGEKDLVFYCHSGGRSMAAATMADEEQLSSGQICNLQGGIMAWDGAMVADYPKVRLFAGDLTAADMMRTAVDLEKGAMLYYRQVHDVHSAQDWARVFDTLSKAELGHARTVFQFWRQFDGGLPEFDALFDSMAGDLLEGGTSMADAVAAAERVQGPVCIRLIELALQIEFAAFDLYRSMADQAADEKARQAFLSLAQSEKAHIRSLAGALTACPSA